MKYAFIEGHSETFHIRRMCSVLEVSVSGYNAWHSRPECERRREDRRLGTRIRLIHERRRRSYGSPRVRAELSSSGQRCSRKRVARLMRAEGLRGKKRRRFRPTTDSHHRHPIAPNVLDRQFEVAACNHVWVADITYLWTVEGWLYLAVLLDLGSRLVVGWSTSPSLDTSLVMAALEQAVTHRDPPRGLLHHSDRGVQYASDAYRERLARLGIKVSMSRKGDCWDNAVMESFFDSLKTELFDGLQIGTRRETELALIDYIDVFYNAAALAFLTGVPRTHQPPSTRVGYPDFRRTTRLRESNQTGSDRTIVCG